MPIEINRKRFLSVQEASQELGLSYPTVLTYVRTGKLTGLRVGRALLIAEAEVARLQGPTSVNLTLRK
jgi:excisionase family DNA binding protein